MSISDTQDSIKSKLDSHFRQSIYYDQEYLIEIAQLLIPIDDITENAKFETSPESCFEINLLKELLCWFKKDFFTWTDAPECTFCAPSKTNQKTVFLKMLSPSQEHLEWGASRVEGFQCNMCTKITPFPRYNHPEKLLETRTGRCGEWANCFTLMCKAVGFEARHVMDWTDHVWNEVYIASWDRWVHCDSCENVYDRPLMYEKGWNKKLSLIVAATSEELVDVTFRYTSNKSSVMEARSKMFKEDWLRDCLHKINTIQSQSLTHERKKELLRRKSIEQAEFFSCEKRSEDLGQYSGRTSGSKEWRLARGEMSSSNSVVPVESDSIVMTIEELNNNLFMLEYNPISNSYKRGNKEIKRWQSLATKYKNIMRKEELDWKKVYLCRKEGNMSPFGFIIWRVNIPSSHLVEEVEVLVKSTTFQSGQVTWILCSDKLCDLIQPSQKTNFSFRYKGAKTLSLNVFLRGGIGDCAWQKSQLFREDLNISTDPSLYFKIKMAKV